MNNQINRNQMDNQINVNQGNTMSTPINEINLPMNNRENRIIKYDNAQNERNIVNRGNPNKLMDRNNMKINSLDKVLKNIENRIEELESRLLNNNNNMMGKLFSGGNNKTEYIILIVVAIIGIYLLDKYLNGGKLF